jgi:predicted nucleic acid-binding protein
VTSAYADASALVKLGIHETESDALIESLNDVEYVLTSVIGQVEFERAIRRRDPSTAERRIERVLAGIDVIPMDPEVVALAGAVHPADVRSLDAIHLATMLALKKDVDVAYIYDARLADAARAHGFEVRAPA